MKEIEIFKSPLGEWTVRFLETENGEITYAGLANYPDQEDAKRAALHYLEDYQDHPMFDDE